VFHEGFTGNSGKLVFNPGEGGNYDAVPSMEVAPNQWLVTAGLGAQTITFKIRTYSR
jgi:hypothetical protein